jgi:hypothetical protein
MVNNLKPGSGSGGCVMTEKNRKAVVRLAIREYLEKQKSNGDFYQRVADILYPPEGAGRIVIVRNRKTGKETL